MRSEAITQWMSSLVDGGHLPGCSTIVMARGSVAFAATRGWRDLQHSEPMMLDTVVRIYSMSKPVTAVATLIAAADGALGLDDPVADYIDSFGNLTVNRAGTGEQIDPVPSRRAMTVRHLLTHTAGLTYGEGNPGAVSRRYVDERTDFGPDDGPLSEVVDRLAAIPLLFEPGSAWCYGVASDVLGRVVEVATGRALDEFFTSRIFAPLGMNDTGFHVAPDRLDRFAALYAATDDEGLELLEDVTSSPQARPVTTLSGGAGLVSSAPDYLRFAEMLRGGGKLEGVRVLDTIAVREMTRNHLPGDLAASGVSTFNETSTAGVGFGFGVSVVVDPSVTAWRSAPGEFAWGGFASTAFWVDPVHDLSVVFLTQVTPSDRYPIRSELRSLIHDGLTDGWLSRSMVSSARSTGLK